MDYPFIKNHSDRSIIRLIIPQQIRERIIKKIFQFGGSFVYHRMSRGVTLSHNRIFRPLMSPLLGVLDTVIHNEMVVPFMDRLTQEAELFMHGRGLIYQLELPQLLAHTKDKKYVNPIKSFSDYILDQEDDEIVPKKSESFPYRTDIVSLICIVQQGKAEMIAKAAMNAGSNGPHISFVRGIGLREWLGFLRITINPDKEFLEVTVPAFDFNHVFEVMVELGKLDKPGMGFIHTSVLSRALINLPSFIDSRYMASIEQIIKAIDDIKKGSDWRVRDLEHVEQTQRSYTHYLTDQTLIVVYCEVGNAERITQTAISEGAPGSIQALVTETFYQEDEMEDEVVPIKKRVSEEKELIEIITPTERVDSTLEAILSLDIMDEPDRGFIYTIPLSRYLTYFG